MLGLLVACVGLHPAAAQSVKMDQSYSGICRSQCGDANRNCSISAAPWTGGSGNRVDGAAQRLFEDRYTNTGAVKANSSFFFETGCWEDWSRYDVHGVKINNSQFTLGCAANQAPNTSPVDAPAMSVFQGQLYDVFESSQTLSW